MMPSKESAPEIRSKLALLNYVGRSGHPNRRSGSHKSAARSIALRQLAQIHARHGEGRRSAVSYLKGAPEVLSSEADYRAERRNWQEKAEAMQLKVFACWRLRGGGQGEDDLTFWDWRCSGIRRALKCRKRSAGTRGRYPRRHDHR